jgi:hypothetical protein
VTVSFEGVAGASGGWPAEIDRHLLLAWPSPTLLVAAAAVGIWC